MYSRDITTEQVRQLWWRAIHKGMQGAVQMWMLEAAQKLARYTPQPHLLGKCSNGRTYFLANTGGGPRVLSFETPKPKEPELQQEMVHARVPAHAVERLEAGAP